MKSLLIVTVGSLALLSGNATAATCAAGVYRAGCAGPNGAVVARRPAPAPAVHCAAGVYRAGCAGPNGAVVAPRPVAPARCYWRAGVRVCT
jgi:hypothetical protein